MKVVQVAIGKFHHFHLARQLDSFHALKEIYCGYPWSKLQHEGVAREKVKTFPWLQAPYMGFGRVPGFNVGPRTRQHWEYWSQRTFDGYVSRSLGDCDALVALSGSGTKCGPRAQSLGARYICDRGSSHIRFQDSILGEEHRLWNIPWLGIDPRIIDREEHEYATANYITVPSTFNEQTFAAHGVNSAKIRRITYGANIFRFSPQGGRDPERFIVLFVGQVSLRKGIPYLLQAFQKFKHPKKELWIVGGQSKQLRDLLRELNSEQIRYLGLVPNAELVSIYSQANVFVLPSIEEGLAMVQGEALACGCPVIATTNTGGEDLFDDGVEGFIVPIRDAGSITDRLTQLADNPILRDQMGNAAVTRMKSLGGWDSYGKSYFDFITEITAGHCTV